MAQMGPESMSVMKVRKQSSVLKRADLLTLNQASEERLASEVLVFLSLV
jgi:hypothetical protein